MSKSNTRSGLLLFTALGYGYLALLVLLLVGAIVVTLVTPVPVQLIFIPGVTLLLVLASLRVRFAFPDGPSLTAGNAPRLFDVLREVSARLDTPMPHVVVLTGDVNASIMDIPRFGVFGARRCLAIGLPLLVALPEDEVRSVLAHELAHLSRRHGRRQARWQRLTTVWQSLAVATQWSRDITSYLFVPFFRWYAPRFEALIEEESRNHEYESNELAAATVGPGVAARALLRIAITNLYAQRELWPRIYRDSEDLAGPPPDAVVRLTRSIHGWMDDPRASSWLRSILRERAIDRDSHPGLSDRLNLLGLRTSPEHAADLTEALRRTQGTAADSLLGRDEVNAYVIDLGEHWKAAVEPQWRRWHAEAGSGGRLLWRRCSHCPTTR